MCVDEPKPKFRAFDYTRCHRAMDFEYASEEVLAIEDRCISNASNRRLIHNNLYEEMLVFYLSEPTDEDYDIMLFLKYVATKIFGMIHNDMDRQVTMQQFLNDYAYTMVNLEIETVEALMMEITTINEVLHAYAECKFMEEHLHWITKCAPIWIKMLARVEIKHIVPIPQAIMDRVEYRDPTPIRDDWDPQELDDGYHFHEDGTPWDSDEEHQDVGYVEYNFHIRSASENTNVWIGDTGASCHMTNSLDGMFNIRQISSNVQVGTGRTVTCTQIGDKRVTIRQQDGTSTFVVLQNVKYLPNFFTNLMSITTLLSNGWRISNEGLMITMSKDDVSFTFDHIIRTDSGFVVGIDLIPRFDMAQLTLATGISMDINKMHQLFGHACEATIRRTAQYYGITLTGNMESCVACALAKARQRNVNKETDVISTMPAERLYIDISSIQYPSLGGSKFWLLVVDHHTDFCWSYFLARKSELIAKLLPLFQSLRLMEGVSPNRFVRCDNAGEILQLPHQLTAAQVPVTFEFIPPGTPQFNGVVERKYQTLYARVRSMLNQTEFPTPLRNSLWAEAANHATDIENMLVTASKPVSSHTSFFGIEHPSVRTLHKFGALAIVEDHRSRRMRGKLTDRGILCAYLGPAPNHSSDCYRFLNLTTRAVIRSRDVSWLHQTYNQIVPPVNEQQAVPFDCTFTSCR